MKTGRDILKGVVLYGSFPAILANQDEFRRRLEQIAADSSFDLVELPLVEDQGQWNWIKGVLEQSGLAVVTSAGPSCVGKGWNLSAIDQKVRTAAVEGMRTMVDFSYAVDSRVLVFISGRDPGDAERPRALDSLCQSISEIADYASSKAMNYVLALSLEPADRAIAHRQLLGPSAEAQMLVARVHEEYPNFRVTLDMSHTAQLGESFETATQALGGYVGHAHLANAIVCDKSHPLYGDQHPYFGIPGGQFGPDDAVRFVEVLRETCFPRVCEFPYGRPVLSVEVKPFVGQDPDLVLAGAKRVLAQATS